VKEVQRNIFKPIISTYSVINTSSPVMQVICYQKKKIATFLVKDWHFFYHLDRGVENLNSCKCIIWIFIQVYWIQL